MTVLSHTQQLLPLRDILDIRNTRDAERWWAALEGCDDTDVRNAITSWTLDRRYEPADIAKLSRSAAAARLRRDAALNPDRCPHDLLDTVADPCTDCGAERKRVAADRAANVRRQLAAKRHQVSS